jgi:hypothetical protein
MVDIDLSLIQDPSTREALRLILEALNSTELLITGKDKKLYALTVEDNRISIEVKNGQ